MKPITEACTVKVFPNYKFRVRVFTANSGHHAATCLSIDYVSHLLQKPVVMPADLIPQIQSHKAECAWPLHE
jgi:hypothetical protein